MPSPEPLSSRRRTLRATAATTWLARAAALLVVALALAGGYRALPEGVTAASCSIFNGNQSACEAQATCEWEAIDCPTLDEAACSGASSLGCTLNYAYCSWDGMSCVGGEACAGVGDEGSCNTTQYYTSCSGTYYPGNCLGDYDGDPPTVIAAEANGNSIVITYSEALDPTADPLPGHFAVSANGSGIGTVSTDADGTTVTLTLEAAVAEGDTVSLTYTPGTEPVTQDLAGNDAGSVSDYSVTNVTDSTPPTIVTVSSDKPDGTYSTGEVIDIDVTFSENVTSAGMVTVTLETGETDRTCTFAVTESTVGSCDYTVQAGDTSADLDVASVTGNVTDGRGNSLATPAVPATNLAANKGIVIADTLAPTVVGVFSDAVGTYGVGDEILIEVHFGEAVTFNGSGDFNLKIENGGESYGVAPYDSGSTSEILVFRYTVQAGDNSSDLDYLDATALELSGGTLRDGAGNDADLGLPTPGATNSLSANEDIAIDGVAPSAPDAPDLRADYDIGVSATDDVTGAALVGVDVYCESDTTVYLKRGNTVLGSNTCVSGLAVIENASLVEGLNSLVATQVDAAGNVSATSSALSVTADFTSPTILSASSSAAAGTYGVGDVIDVDLEFSEAVASVGGETTVTLETGATDRTCTFTASGSTYATCDYTVQAGDVSADLTVSSVSGHLEDIAGNDYADSIGSNMAANEAIVIDGVVPSAPTGLDLVAGSDTGASATDNLTADDTPEIAVSCETGSTVYLKEGNTVLGSGACSSSAASVTSSALADAAHSLIATQVDAAGNVSATSSALSVTVDTTDPSVALDEPGGGDTVSGSVALAATASDGGAGLVGVRFYVDGVAEGAEDTGSPFGVTWDTTGVADGDHDVSAAARDAAGNYATSTVTVTVSNAGGPGPDPDPTPTETPRSPRHGSSSGRVGGGGGSSSSGGAPSGGSSGTFGYGSGIAASGRDLEVGSQGEDVRALQRFLNARGFTVAASGPGSVGDETDLFGPATRAALARFQEANGIVPAAGYFGPRTRALVAGGAGAAPDAAAPAAYSADAPAPTRDLDLGSQGADVEALQLLLIQRATGPAAAALGGYGPSGYFGALTQAALSELQRSLGISPATGYYGPRTRAALGL